MQRTETNTFSDFFAFCGGLLGLYLGISVVSGIELIYFFSLRLFWNIWKSRSEELIETSEVEAISERPKNTENIIQALVSQQMK